MSRKRSSRDAGDVLLQQRDSNNDSSSAPKRQAGTTAHPAPGQLSSAAVAAWLHSLGFWNNAQLQGGAVLSAEGWQAFAELNILVSRYLSDSDSMPDALLRGYHSFTLQPRAALWQVYSRYAEAGAKAGERGTQLGLLRYLLEWVLAPYPDASLTEVTLQLPPWMAGWASRWGLAGSMAGSSSRITLIMVEAFAPLDPGSSRSAATPRRPVRKLFIPAIS